MNFVDAHYWFSCLTRPCRVSLHAQVYKEPYAKRHYAGLFSTAVFYRLVAWILAIIVSFVVALTTGDMWIKNNVFLEQPSVRFGYDLVLILEVSPSRHFSSSHQAKHLTVWSALNGCLLWATIWRVG